MLTGINFSPSLYFLFNFCLQLVFPTSIEQLRVQSLVFIIFGIVLSFLLTRKMFGKPAAFFATILVLSQSHLLLSQAQEARHYAMFFACGAWVLFVQSLDDDNAKKNKWLTFFSHFCLCQVHYLGIIFSGLSGTVYYLTSKKNGLWERIPIPIAVSLLLSVLFYFFYLINQKSVLNTWSKPNELSDLLTTYNDSLLIITILIPFIALSKTSYSKGDTKTLPKKETGCSTAIMITSVLWLSVPFLFWVLSHLSSLNLFVDRYFIPKESALIFLTAYGFSFILQKLNQRNLKNIPLLGTFGLSLILILVSTKRIAFGLNKDTNYHHSLIIEETYPPSEQPIIFEGDPKYFPNDYLGKNECLFSIKNESLIELYQNFSSKIKFLDQ